MKQSEVCFFPKVLALDTLNHLKKHAYTYNVRADIKSPKDDFTRLALPGHPTIQRYFWIWLFKCLFVSCFPTLANLIVHLNVKCCTCKKVYFRCDREIEIITLMMTVQKCFACILAKPFLCKITTLRMYSRPAACVYVFNRWKRYLY